jgi:hypothetical protein
MRLGRKRGLAVPNSGGNRCRRRLQVPAKALWCWKIHEWWIDVVGGWRYSQAQIQDLVAYAIPRFRKAAQSLSSAARRVRRFPAKSDAFPTAGAKARVHSRLLAARMNSCSDTKLYFYAICSVMNCQLVLVSGTTFLVTGETDADEVYAVAIDRIGRQITSTSQHCIGGHRNL